MGVLIMPVIMQGLVEKKTEQAIYNDRGVAKSDWHQFIGGFLLHEI